MVNESITVDKAIDYLNELVWADRFAVSIAISVRVPCNERIADHKSLQVWTDKDQGFSFTMLGFLNGLFGVDEKGHGPISAVFMDNDERRLSGFVRTDSL